MTSSRFVMNFKFKKNFPRIFTHSIYAKFKPLYVMRQTHKLDTIKNPFIELKKDKIMALNYKRLLSTWNFCLSVISYLC